MAHLLSFAPLSFRSASFGVHLSIVPLRFVWRCSQFDALPVLFVQMSVSCSVVSKTIYSHENSYHN